MSHEGFSHVYPVSAQINFSSCSFLGICAFGVIDIKWNVSLCGSGVEFHANTTVLFRCSGMFWVMTLPYSHLAFLFSAPWYSKIWVSPGLLSTLWSSVYRRGFVFCLAVEDILGLIIGQNMRKIAWAQDQTGDPGFVSNLSNTFLTTKSNGCPSRVCWGRFFPKKMVDSYEGERFLRSASI